MNEWQNAVSMLLNVLMRNLTINELITSCELFFYLASFDFAV